MNSQAWDQGEINMHKPRKIVINENWNQIGAWMIMHP
jgi:hypothetical protein